MIDESGEMLGRMADLLEGRRPDVLQVTRREIYEFLTKRAGVRLVPKVVELLDSVYDKAERQQIIRAIVRAGRGSGKTYTIAKGVEFVLWFFFGYDFVNLGGSGTQALRAYKYIGELIKLDEINVEVERSVMRETVHREGQWMAVLAASERQTRSPHPGGPGRGGGLFIDEEAEVQSRSLVTSAIPVVNTAVPSAIVRSSTQHKVGKGKGDATFEECWDNASRMKYERFGWDAFDVCQTCRRRCEVSIEDDEVNGCYDAFRMDVLDVDGTVKKEGYCKGRAHRDGYEVTRAANGDWARTYREDWDWKSFAKRMGFSTVPEGWIAMDELIQNFLDVDSETFEVEWLGRKIERKGKVYDGDLLDRAYAFGDAFVEPNADVFRMCEKALGVDWGYSSEACVTWAFRWRKWVVVYWVEYMSRKLITRTVADIDERARVDNVEEAYCDSEGAYENAELGQKMTVKSVAFSTWKDYGVGNVKAKLEHENLIVLRSWRGRKVPGAKRFEEQMRGYRFDEHGNYVKENDHGPDSILCCLLKWARAKLTHATGGRRVKGEPRLAVIK